MGLRIMQERAQRMGAHVRVRSAPGAGCTVVLELPPRAGRPRAAACRDDGLMENNTMPRAPAGGRRPHPVPPRPGRAARRRPTLRVVGEAADAAEAVRRARELQPDLVLLDNHLPGATGIQALGDLKGGAAAKFVLLTVSEDEGDLHLALRNGANGYLLKTIEGDVLTTAIHRVMRGEPVISPELMGKLLAALQARHDTVQAPVAAAADTGPALSPREQEVLRQIALGASNKEIARTLDIAETTVKIHVQHICASWA